MTWDAIDIAATVLLLAATVMALRQFRRYRKALPIFEEWRLFKARLPRSVAIIERVVVLVVWVTVWVAFALAAMFVRYTLRPGAEDLPSLTIFATAIAALPVAALIANIIVLSIPPIYRANVRAMTGLAHASLGRAMKELFYATIVVVPIGLIIAVLGAMEPRLS